MLNTLPPSPACPRPPVPVVGGVGVPLPSRRRGGQPSNHNALRHGYFALRNPTPLTQLVNSIQVSTTGLDVVPEVLRQAIPALRQQIARLFAASPKGGDLSAILAWHRPINHLLDLFLRLQKALARFEAPHRHLQFVAAHALALIRYEFRENGITRDAYSFRENHVLSDFNSSTSPENSLTRPPYSFREKILKSDLNSPPFQENASPSLSGSPHPFLTSRQWQVLEPLLPSPNVFSIWGGAGGRAGEGPGVRPGEAPSMGEGSPSRRPSPPPRCHLLETCPGLTRKSGHD